MYIYYIIYHVISVLRKRDTLLQKQDIILKALELIIRIGLTVFFLYSINYNYGKYDKQHCIVKKPLK